MDDSIKKFVKDTISELIRNTSGDKKIEELVKKHSVKIHFIPVRYRIFSGLLQSMNIQFGNFIEKLLHVIIENEEGLDIHAKSGKKMELQLTKKSNELIDKYITDCKTNNSNEVQLLKNFNTLIDQCLNIESSEDKNKIPIKHDIDILFSNQDNKTFYLEVKYNDDHDTGKYADINRKFLKSYIGISNVLKTYDRNIFKPILYYFTQKKLKENIYLPEEENIYRGNKLFTEFFTINYQDIDNLMNNIGDDSDIVELFDDLYNEIRCNLHL